MLAGIELEEAFRVAKKKLQAGGTCRIYRAGGGVGDLLASVIVPESGPFEVRHLAPGRYVARDEAGTEVEFSVDPKAEVALVQRGSGERVPGAEPGTARVHEIETERSGEPARVEGEAPVFSGSDGFEANDRVGPDDRVPGEPGSALIELEPEPEAA